MPIRDSQKRRYPDDWAAISRRIRFERAGGRCECRNQCGSIHDPNWSGRCEARHGEAHPITQSRVVLTTAHLDHTPENVDDSNLLAMCQACHLAYDAEHHAATRARTRTQRERDAGQGMMFGGDATGPAYD